MRRLSCSVALAAALLPVGAFFHADTAVASDTSLIDMNQVQALSPWKVTVKPPRV